MMATYSPHREDREAVHHHSPKAISHFDAIREIRRSLSRSPSKTSDLRQYPFRSPGPSNLPFSPSPLSPSRKSTSESLSQLASIMSPHSSRTSQTPRFQRPILRRSTQTHGLNRVRTSPKSPSKRVLADSSDGGNSSPQPLRKRNSTEADRELALKCLTGEVTENDARQHEEPLTWKTAQTRQEKRRSGGALMSTIAPLSPMKRTEGPRSDDNQPFESSAKRRSLHGPGLDFSIFESDDLDGGMFMDKRSQDDNDCFSSNGSIPSTRFSTIPKRSSSLRKSTLQQRQLDRPSNLKFNHVMDLDKSWLESSTPSTSTKRGFRISLDNHLEPLRRESPFSSQGSLPNASIHPATSTLGSTSSQQLSRHPLSRALTQSSSFTGDEDDSPTHEPVHRPTRPRSHDFSKSLPIGSSRPVPSPENHDFSSQSSFATPGNYRAAKPLPAAFMSTGLISKKNRNVEDPNAGLPKAHMPDTPCKKQSVIYQADEKFAAPKPAAHRASRPSFGQPSTPLDAQYNQPKISVFPFARSAGIFGTRSSKHNLLRKTSFASIESDEKAGSRSPLTRANSQSTDSDYPPTPTKHLPDEQNRNSISPSPHHAGGLTATHHAPSSGFGARLTNSKLSPISASPKGVDGDSDSMMEDSPSANLRPVSVPKDISLSDSYTRARMSKNLNFPTPLARKDPSLSTFHSPALDRAKISVPSVSPRATPHTPLEGFFPPDPSGLSISGRAERPRNPSNTGKGPIVPATPTGPREYFSNFSNRPSLNLAAVDGSNLDISLTSRFEKVDLIGSGEFSQVFRVSQPPEASPFHKIYSVSSSRPSSRGSIPEKVWAVKKSRYPYSGAKDRQRKIQEVDVLKALGHSDHIVTFVDSWEEQGHLYIQTEFCEEGTLDVFLAQMGLKARLDDFRIWKILLELSVGLKHIHESGFIHLDLKPANILITFEGVLRIADFGMASRWPAKPGIEAEGDREYIGPEILMGRYDKPADIFALGLIMLETAGNVELPDNGVSWQKLRNGDMSDVPSLTWSSGTSGIERDSTGNPLSRENSFNEQSHSSQTDVEVVIEEDNEMLTGQVMSKNLCHPRSGELVNPPQFMIDPSHEQALDRVVRWMISPDPSDRPLASDLLGTEGVRWAETRRRAGATVFEGNWGPADEVLAEDAEMIDV